MTNVSEHDSKQEWESHRGEEGWICFLVPGHTISVNNLLGNLGEVIGNKVSGWFHVLEIYFFYLDAEPSRRFIRK